MKCEKDVFRSWDWESENCGFVDGDGKECDDKLDKIVK